MALEINFILMKVKSAMKITSKYKQCNLLINKENLIKIHFS